MSAPDRLHPVTELLRDTVTLHPVAAADWPGTLEPCVVVHIDGARVAVSYHEALTLPEALRQAADRLEVSHGREAQA